MNLGNTGYGDQEIKSSASLLVLSVCVLTFLVMPSRADAASQCKNAVGAYSYSVTKSLARKQARIAWRGYVVRKYGPLYAVWRLGKDRSSSCKRKRFSPVYRCSVRAKPCR